MKVRRGDVILDLMLVLAATTGTSVAASHELHLTTFGFTVVAVSVVLLVCANFLWDLRRQSYKKLSGLGRAIMMLAFVMNLVAVLSTRSSSAAVHPLLHNLFYFFLAMLISMLVIDGIRQNREKQILRSVKDNGTV
jgi:UDP-N-acetylmuramyl pentapeptide phosphotransferase/UDP-N-acetylglucosamine-1-phosphate transferase